VARKQTRNGEHEVSVMRALLPAIKAAALHFVAMATHAQNSSLQHCSVSTKQVAVGCAAAMDFRTRIMLTNHSRSSKASLPFPLAPPSSFPILSPEISKISHGQGMPLCCEKLVQVRPCQPITGRVFLRP